MSSLEFSEIFPLVLFSNGDDDDDDDGVIKAPLGPFTTLSSLSSPRDGYENLYIENGISEEGKKKTE